MPEYVVGTTPAGELQAMQVAFSRAASAIQAWPDPTEACQAMQQLSELAAQIYTETADFHGWLTLYLKGYHNATNQELATFMGVTPQRISQLLKRGHKQKGNPVTEPATLPEQLHIALAVITSGRNVLIAQRKDKIPPWTFPGGDIEPGESPDDTLRRRVPAETGLSVASVRLIGRRIHPMTSRVTVYSIVEVDAGEPHLGDPDDLSEVRWATIDETRFLMPDMYPVVRAYLDDLLRSA